MDSIHLPLIFELFEVLGDTDSSVYSEFLEDKESKGGEEEEAITNEGDKLEEGDGD